MKEWRIAWFREEKSPAFVSIKTISSSLQTQKSANPSNMSKDYYN